MNDPQASIRKQVQRLRLLYMHVALYLVVNLALTAINLTSSPHQLWFYWAWLGWGIAVAFHIVGALGLARLWVDEWTERKVEELSRKRES